MRLKKFNPFVLLFMVVGVLALTGCSQEPSPPARDNNPASSQASQRHSMVYDIQRILELDPVKIRIVNVGVVRFDESRAKEKGQIALGLEIANTGDQEVRYFPEQITISNSSGKILLPDVTISEEMSGTYPPQRVMRGFIIFPLGEKTPEEFNHLTIKFPAAVDQANQPLGNGLKIDLDLKKVETAG